MSRSLIFALGVLIGILACTLVWQSAISRDPASISMFRDAIDVDYV